MKRAALLILLAGCGEEPVTELVVVIETDLAVPAELDAFAVRVRDRDDVLVVDRSFLIGTADGEATLPADFGVSPRGGDDGATVTVEVDALESWTRLFTVRARTGFLPDRRLRLDLFLADRCRTESCAEQESCGRQGCVPAEVDPTTLPEMGQ